MIFLKYIFSDLMYGGATEINLGLVYEEGHKEGLLGGKIKMTEMHLLQSKIRKSPSMKRWPFRSLARVSFLALFWILMATCILDHCSIILTSPSIFYWLSSLCV